MLNLDRFLRHHVDGLLGFVGLVLTDTEIFFLGVPAHICAVGLYFRGRRRRFARRLPPKTKPRCAGLVPKGSLSLTQNFVKLVNQTEIAIDTMCNEYYNYHYKRINMKKNTEQLSFDYYTCFKNIYYTLYSNSNTSRAERLISDITKILLCKLMYENTQKKLDPSISGKELISQLRKSYPQCCEQFDDFSLEDKDIYKVLSSIECISLLDAPANIMGDAFQAIIGPTIRGDKGQFFTPKELVECIVSIMKPCKGEIVMDPACGTGGFLSQAYVYCADKEKKSKKEITLIGIDKDRDMADMALATTEIISKGHSIIYNRNSLELLKQGDSLNSLIGSVDVILTNPPFGSKIGISDERVLSTFDFGYNWTFSETDQTWYKLNTIAKNQVPQVLFIELCVRLLKDGGRMAIVLPEGIFGNKTLGFIWAYLKKNGRILGMIDCPRSTFQPSTDTKTNVLFYQKGLKYDDKILVSVAKYSGHDKRGRVVNLNNTPYPNDFIAIANDFNNGNVNGYWKTVHMSGSYFVPRYMAGLVRTSTDDKYISIGEMLDRGFLIRKSGKEVGSDAYGTGSIPFVRTSDIINFEISSDPTNAVSDEIYEQYAKQQNLAVGDILFIADGRYRIGKTAIITENNIKCLIQSHIEILSLTKKAPFTPYEFLYSLNMDEVQEQVRSLIFIQSTLGTIGNRIKEIVVKKPERNREWNEKIHAFQNNIEMRARCLSELKDMETNYEL